MKILEYMLGRSAGLHSSRLTHPQGGAYLPELAEKLTERYKFLAFPQQLSDPDFAKGVQFTYGKYNDAIIDRLVIFSDGLFCDTRV